MDKYNVKTALAYFVAGLISGCIIGYWIKGAADAKRCTGYCTSTDTVTVVDTVRYSQLVAKDSIVVRQITARLPVVQPINDGGKVRTMQMADAQGNASASDNHGVDIVGADVGERGSEQVIVPIVQKKYSDSTYTAWVSGYEPQLDSIYVYQRTRVIRERTYKPPNKWHIGVQAGYGYGREGFTPYVGIGITYSIISF